MNPSDPQPEYVEATLETRTKPWWQSKTILGSAAAILTTLLGIFFQADFRQDEVSELLFGLAAVAGSALAIYGRLKAKTEIQAPRAVRATPDEIARARGRGGLNKGSSVVEFLVPLGLVIFFLALAGLLSGCARNSHPTNAARSNVVELRKRVASTEDALTYPENADRRAEFQAELEYDRLLIANNLAAIHRADATPSLMETERIQLTAFSPVAIGGNFVFGVVTWPVALLAAPSTGRPAEGLLWPFAVAAWTVRGIGDEFGEIEWLEGATK